MVRGFAVAGLVVAACQFPRPSDRQPDAGPDAPIDAPVDARPDLVTGRSITRHTTSTGVVDVANDLTAFSVQALIPDAASPGAVRTIAGIGRADGTFEVEGVPPDLPYFIKVGRDPALTDQHQLEFTHARLTRAGISTATSPTMITLNATGAAAFQPNDTLMLASNAADVGVFIGTNAGTTTLEQTFDWTAVGQRLVDTSLGDDFGLYHYRVTAAPTTGEPEVRQIVSAHEFANTALADGVAQQLTAPLAVPAGRLGLDIRIDRTRYDVGQSPSTRLGPTVLECFARPALVGTASQYVPSPIFAATVSTWDAVDNTGIAAVGSYVDPFPEPWPRVCRVAYTRLRAVRIPGTTDPFVFNASTFRVSPPTIVAAPPMPPPTTIRIAGLDGETGGLIVNDGAPITVSWTGSAQATQYEFAIYQLRAQGSRTTFAYRATFSTTETSLSIPALFFVGLDFIAFEVTARAATNNYAAGELVANGVPGASASAVTAMFRWSATCGNGAPDLGEDCDASGASAACDADCTAVVCGDGTRNAAAGELCDSIVDTVGCDDDCTANTCGDGHRNEATEECDDGGIAPGDGCSATCRTE